MSESESTDGSPVSSGEASPEPTSCMRDLLAGELGIKAEATMINSGDSDGFYLRSAPRVTSDYCKIWRLVIDG